MIPPFDVYIHIYPSPGEPTDPFRRQADGQSVLVARPWHFDGGWRHDQPWELQWKGGIAVK